MTTMKKTELHDMVLETMHEYITEAELSTGDNTFTIKVAVNKKSTLKSSIQFSKIKLSMRFNVSMRLKI